MLASTAHLAQFLQISQNWPCYLAQPFHALFARISCNTFLGSLKHTDQPWVGFVYGAWNFIKNCLSLLWYICWQTLSVIETLVVNKSSIPMDSPTTQFHGCFIILISMTWTHFRSPCIESTLEYKLLYRCVVYCVPPCRLFQSGCGLNSPQVFKKWLLLPPYMRGA